MRLVDLNCDLGEGHDDEAVLPLISSASLACGLHAGDAPTLRRTLAGARRAGVAVGAHPSFPDREGFGRRALPLPADEVYDHVVYQLGALDALARRAGVRLGHLKPHGALYHAADERPEIGAAIVAAARDFRDDLLLVGFPGGAFERAAAVHGLRFAAEGFADRGYGDDGRLLPRGAPGAQIEADDDAVAARAVFMAEAQAVPTVGGLVIPRPLATICLHGDEPGAPARARAIRAALLAAGFRIAPVSTWR